MAIRNGEVAMQAKGGLIVCRGSRFRREVITETMHDTLTGDPRPPLTGCLVEINALVPARIGAPASCVRRVLVAGSLPQVANPVVIAHSVSVVKTTKRPSTVDVEERQSVRFVGNRVDIDNPIAMGINGPGFSSDQERLHTM